MHFDTNVEFMHRIVVSLTAHDHVANNIAFIWLDWIRKSHKVTCVTAWDFCNFVLKLIMQFFWNRLPWVQASDYARGVLNGPLNIP